MSLFEIRIRSCWRVNVSIGKQDAKKKKLKEKVEKREKSFYQLSFTLCKFVLNNESFSWNFFFFFWNEKYFKSLLSHTFAREQIFESFKIVQRFFSHRKLVSISLTIVREHTDGKVYRLLRIQFNPPSLFFSLANIFISQTYPSWVGNSITLYVCRENLIQWELRDIIWIYLMYYEWGKARRRICKIWNIDER